MATTTPRSTADARRATVAAAAVRVFARTGYHATPVTEVAEAARISPAYVFRLFDSKLGVFLAALDHCFDRIVEALEEGADRAPDGEPTAALAAMGDAYAELISDRDLLMLQVHALSAVDVPEIVAKIREGYARVVTFARRRTGAPDAAIQQFIAYGQLCHLIVAAGLDDVSASWATALTAGMAHPSPTAPPG
jgi:AcrR family transcriptional regulator